MIEQMPTNSPKILGFKLNGTLHDADYRMFEPVVEAALANEGKVSLLAQMEDFHGWDLHAAWDDLKFGIEHFSDFERIAMVGDKRWEAWMAQLCKPFTRARVKYFDTSQADQARAWLEDGAGA